MIYEYAILSKWSRYWSRSPKQFAPYEAHWGCDHNHHYYHLPPICRVSNWRVRRDSLKVLFLVQKVHLQIERVDEELVQYLDDWMYSVFVLSSGLVRDLTITVDRLFWRLTCRELVRWTMFFSIYCHQTSTHVEVSYSSRYEGESYVAPYSREILKDLMILGRSIDNVELRNSNHGPIEILKTFAKYDIRCLPSDDNDGDYRKTDPSDSWSPTGKEYERVFSGLTKAFRREVHTFWREILAYYKEEWRMPSDIPAGICGLPRVEHSRACIVDPRGM